MSHPGFRRSTSTNIGASSGYRRLEGKIAIVTGASRGIGKAICKNLGGKGCSLIMNYTSDTSAEPTQTLASDLKQEYGITTIVIQADMGHEAGPAHLVETARNHLKHPKTGKFTIDIIINNAGVANNLSIEEANADDFAFQYNVNVRGPLFLMKAALPYLPTDRSGRIVNLSSVSASMGFHKQSVYGGTKAALEAMTRTWSRELSERATVNSVNPGPVDTDMYAEPSPEWQRRMAGWLLNTPLAAGRDGIDPPEVVERAKKDGGRTATADEIAGVVAMLCSADSGFCTGSVICANGGMRFSP
ncbi:NAD(P)-binding protein [Aulographum hederae CBS 113979]|uniref:NAD(P)-binding protein n=1 Tax=Aulographum hederae CBS 113979 TaxID=1176131 RepID=A0A6G1H4V3_9PEZI|nr:NAD(P)-binding protein [Aulographum hederae CBS 113979]